jgi:hypothetical protein
MFGLYLLLGVATAEPQFTHLKTGECAPFDGRLLNDEAITKIAVEDKFKLQQCNLQIDYELQKQKQYLDLQSQKEKIELDMKISVLEEKVKLREERILSLEKLSSPVRPAVYIAAGFVLGAGATIGIVHAVH